LRFTATLDVTTLSPFYTTSAIIVDLSSLTMAHFVRFDPQGRMLPELIVALPSQQNGGVSRDGRTIVYHLRHGVKWSDGAPFDADDVAYTLRFIADRNNTISDREAWDHLRGFDEPDKYTIVLHLDAPFAPFAERFFSSFSQSCVLPQHLLGNGTNLNQSPYNALPVGIGPFRYTAFHRGDAVEMEADPNYFGTRPKLQKIVYKIIEDENTAFTQLQTGELDLWSQISGTFYDRVRALPGVDVTLVPSVFMSGIFFETEHPALRDPVVRRALRLAADRNLFFEKIFHRVGVMSESVVSPSSLDYVALPATPYDPAAANRLLDAAGWARGPDGVRAKGGVRLTLELVLPDGYPPSAQLAELLRVEWQQIGVEVESKQYTTGQYFGLYSAGGILRTGKFDVALLSLGSAVFADVFNGYGCAYAPPIGNDFTHYCNRAVDADMSTYQQTYDVRKRAALAARFQHRIHDDVPVIVIYARSFPFAYSSRVTGLHPQTFGTYDGIASADVR
jgi:peptide/nickel transport system substrate-binding protein